MKKGKVYRKYFYVVVFLSTCICFSGCGSAAEKEADGNFEKENHGMEGSSSLDSGSDAAPKEILDADGIKETKWDYDIRKAVEKILANQNKEGYDSMMSMISVCVTEDTEVLQNGKKYYISKVPFYCWDAKRNRMSGNAAALFVLSEEFEAIGFCELVFEKEKYRTCSYTRATKGELMENLKEKPRCKYIAVMNGYKTNLLDSENTFLYPPYNPKIKIEGDYYHAIDYETIGVSYEELVNKENLIEVTL